jgi:hypothetical protein
LPFSLEAAQAIGDSFTIVDYNPAFYEVQRKVRASQREVSCEMGPGQALFGDFLRGKL